MTFDELIEKTPEEWQPIVREYAPLLLSWTQAEVWAFIQDLAHHRTDEAWRKLLNEMTAPDLLAEGESLVDTWSALNKKNSEYMATQRKAAMAIMQVLLGAALALVGL